MDESEKIKIIAMYLPQFYETKENNKWWGEGFTDWIPARNAKKIYENHYQPHLPLNDNFYNLLDKDTMVNQCKLIHKYNIYGMCFYHYWFKNGKKILEKPAENLLMWKDINMPFCFSWANESWARTWSNLSDKNVWVSYGENKEERINDPEGILLKQEYGKEEEWIEHYRYLSDFFKDDRYIKINNKPVFLIYRPLLIDCFEQMKFAWEKMAIKDGFEGIYFIGCNIPYDSNYDKIAYQEPQHAIDNTYHRPYSSNFGIRSYYLYEELWNKIILEKDDERYIYGGFVGYDNTPRKGVGGTVIDNASPTIFKKYLKMLLKKNELNNNSLVFINAWNEWGEGMHLEPDKKYGYEYLQAVKEALHEYKDVNIKLNNKQNNEINDEKFIIKRYESYWIALNQWLILKEKNIKLSDYLKKQGINKVSIYGIGMLGKHLLNELRDSDVSVEYGIDVNAHNITIEIPLYDINKEEYIDIDAIIVTITYDFDNIYKILKNKTNAKIISLMKILKESENRDE